MRGRSPNGSVSGTSRGATFVDTNDALCNNQCGPFRRLEVLAERDVVNDQTPLTAGREKWSGDFLKGGGNSAAGPFSESDDTSGKEAETE